MPACSQRASHLVTVSLRVKLPAGMQHVQLDQAGEQPKPATKCGNSADRGTALSRVCTAAAPWPVRRCGPLASCKGHGQKQCRNRAAAPCGRGLAG